MDGDRPPRDRAIDGPAALDRDVEVRRVDVAADEARDQHRLLRVDGTGDGDALANRRDHGNDAPKSNSNPGGVRATGCAQLKLRVHPGARN